MTNPAPDRLRRHRPAVKDPAHHVESLDPDARATPHGLSTKPPFYQIDWVRNSIEPRQLCTDADWDSLIGVIREHGLTRVNARGQLTDSALDRLSRVDQITSLNCDGTRNISDDGLLHLARMPQLEELDISDGQNGRLTDRGMEVLRHLPALQRFAMCWQQSVSDAGVANLGACAQLEKVDLLGTATGDGALRALRHKRELSHLKTGRLVTDAGLALLHEFPVFKEWQGGQPRYDLMSFGDAEPNHLLLDGPFTNAGLATLAGLDGIFGLGFLWHANGITSAGLGALATFPNLGALGCQGSLCDDTAMEHIAKIPDLRMLMAQGAIATDDGFTALSASKTIEHIWGRDTANLGGRGFRALAAMPALQGLAVSCTNVDDGSLAALPNFPALRWLVPMGVHDAGFRHVGACAALEKLTCMYCRDTGDAATAQLAGLTKLVQYYAGQTQITDRSLELLSGMPSLEDLAFSACAGISDAGLGHLARLPRLTKLAIDQTARVTRAGVMAIPARVRVTFWT